MHQSDGGGLFSAVLASAASFGEQPAVIAAGQRLSYEELVHTVGALATALADLGLEDILYSALGITGSDYRHVIGKAGYRISGNQEWL